MAEIRTIDFFCGGMTYGLRQAGIDVVAGEDFDVDSGKQKEQLLGEE